MIMCGKANLILSLPLPGTPPTGLSFILLGFFYEITTRESVHMLTPQELKEELIKNGEKAVEIGQPMALSIVRRLGGVKAVADLIEIPKVSPVTVNNWIHNGLPPNYTTREALKRIARRKYKKGAVLTKLLKDIQEARTIRIKQGLRT